MLCCKKILKMIRKNKTRFEEEKDEKDNKNEKGEKGEKDKKRVCIKPIENPYTTKIFRPQMDDIKLKEIIVGDNVENKDENNDENKGDIKVEKDEKIKTKIERLYCTHCGYLFPKPKLPVNYIITCEKCNRPLDLPKHYYV